MLISFLCLAALAAANGANDVSRAVATLLGGRVAEYRHALRWTVLWTLLGSLLSAQFGMGVARRFATVLSSQPQTLRISVPAVLLGASVWVALCTWRRLPVSTTHSLLGSLLGVTLLSGGWRACSHIDLFRGFVLPLLASPVIACAFSWLLSSLLRRLPSPGMILMDRAHWLSAGMTALSRGVNDSAKIWAIALPLSLISGISHFSLSILLTTAAAMLAGALVSGRRVTETLAFRIVPMSGAEGSSANFVTAATIIGASLLSFPVASSHVVSGAIFGVGIAGKHRLLHRRTLAAMAGAWVVTLPAAALVAGGIYLAFERLASTGISGLWIDAILLLSAALLVQSSLRQQRSSRLPLPTRLVVFVCNSNTSRSPMAERICASLLERIRLQSQVKVISRGITAREGEPLAALAGETLRRTRVPNKPHAAINLDAPTVDKANLIFCMSDDQVAAVRNKFPQAAGKLARLDPERDIPNPAGQDAAFFSAVAAQLTAALDARLNRILAPSS